MAFDIFVALKHPRACERLLDAWGKSDGLPRRRIQIQEKAQKARESGLCTAEQLKSIAAPMTTR